MTPNHFWLTILFEKKGNFISEQISAFVAKFNPLSNLPECVSNCCLFVCGSGPVLAINFSDIT